MVCMQIKLSNYFFLWKTRQFYCSFCNVFHVLCTIHLELKKNSQVVFRLQKILHSFYLFGKVEKGFPISNEKSNFPSRNLVWRNEDRFVPKSCIRSAYHWRHLYIHRAEQILPDPEYVVQGYLKMIPLSPSTHVKLCLNIDVFSNFLHIWHAQKCTRNAQNILQEYRKSKLE